MKTIQKLIYSKSNHGIIFELKVFYSRVFFHSCIFVLSFTRPATSGRGDASQYFVGKKGWLSKMPSLKKARGGEKREKTRGGRATRVIRHPRLISPLIYSTAKRPNDYAQLPRGFPPYPRPFVYQPRLFYAHTRPLFYAEQKALGFIFGSPGFISRGGNSYAVV